MRLLKNGKRLIKMISIILLIITMFNFLCSSGLTAYATGEVTYTTTNEVLGGIADGIVGFLTIPIRLLIVLFGGAIDFMIDLFVDSDQDVDVAAVLFNKLDLTNVDFFANCSNKTVKEIKINVASWYTGMRNLALAFLVIICIYVGIRMALATSVDDKAQYKRMLTDWVASVALVFVIHFAMVAVVKLNAIIVNAIGNASLSDTTVSELSDSFRSGAFTIFFVKGTTSAVAYFMLQLMTITVLLMYIKRMITVAFLMLIAPLVTITYSIDKMGDGKAQALNTWFKEFSYTILIQPFHCLAYAALGGIATAIVHAGGGHDLMAGVFVILLITFILQSEKIVKKIFHFESSSLQDVLASAAIASTFIDKGRGFASKTAGAAKAAKELKGNMPMIKERLKNGGNTEKNETKKEQQKPKQEKKKKEKPIDYSSLTETERKQKLKELKDQKFRLQTGATKKEMAFRAFMGANKIGLSTALGMGIGGATGSDQAMFTKGFQDFTNSSVDAMKKGKEFSKGRLRHEIAKSYNTARDGVMEKVKQQYYSSGKGKGKKSDEQQREIEKIFDDRMKGLLNGKTSLVDASDEEKDLAKLLNQMKGSLIMEGYKSNDSIEECLSLLKEIEAGEVSEVWSGEGAGAVPTYILGDKSKNRNVEANIVEMKKDYRKLTGRTDRFKEVEEGPETLNPGDDN